MIRSLLMLALIVPNALPALAADDHVMVTGDQLKWIPAPPAFPKGAEIAVLAGDPSKDGQYVIRLKAPAGYKVPPHSHPFDENVTVISGSFVIAPGEKMSDQHPVLKPGGFARMPKGTVHYALFPEATVIQIHGLGPQGIIYANPGDDPRK
jgi:quercetin dioxygenase-like cupin family protein